MKKSKIVIISMIILCVLFIVGMFLFFPISKESEKIDNYIDLEKFSTYIDSVYFSWINYPDCKVEKNYDLFENEKVMNEFLEIFGISPELEFIPEKYESLEYDAIDYPYRQIDGKVLVPFKTKEGEHYYMGLVLNNKGKVKKIDKKMGISDNTDNSISTTDISE